MITIEIKGQTYQVGRLNALAQFHVSRRLSPLLATLGTSLASLRGGLSLDLSEFLPLLEPITEIMASMPEDSVNYVIFTCLGVVKRQQGEKFASVTTGNHVMFEDIDMPVMIQLVVAVLKENLGNFLMELSAEAPSPTNSPAPTTAQP